MSQIAAIVQALRAAGRCERIRSSRSLGGGCIHTVLRVDLADGSTVAAKVNRASMIGVFEEESAGLRAIAATGTVHAPDPIGVAATGDAAALVLEWLEPGPADESAWRRFGEDLARMHGADAGTRYGFDTDNHLGSTPQPNGWCDDWIEFNAVHRLGHQVKLARDADRLTAGEVRCVQRIIDRLDQLIPRCPPAALLHGDLWSGNAMPARWGGGAVGGRIAVIDPACSIGDGWADIAMMKLFGGFPQSCFDAYRALVQDHDSIDSRIAVYQLYHALNHVNIFGRGYAGQTMALCNQLT